MEKLCLSSAFSLCDYENKVTLCVGRIMSLQVVCTLILGPKNVTLQGKWDVTRVIKSRICSGDVNWMGLM